MHLPVLNAFAHRRVDFAVANSDHWDASCVVRMDNHDLVEPGKVTIIKRQNVCETVPSHCSNEPRIVSILSMNSVVDDKLLASGRKPLVHHGRGETDREADPFQLRLLQPSFPNHFRRAAGSRRPNTRRQLVGRWTEYILAGELPALLQPPPHGENGPAGQRSRTFVSMRIIPHVPRRCFRDCHRPRGKGAGAGRPRLESLAPLGSGLDVLLSVRRKLIAHQSNRRIDRGGPRLETAGSNQLVDVLFVFARKLWHGTPLTNDIMRS